jgi:acetoin utilization protein AcuB
MNQLHVPVEEYTTPNPITATSDMSIDEVNNLMKVNGIRHLPVVDGERVVGIVSDRDLRVAMGLSSREKFLVRASDIMINDPVTVSAADLLEDVAFVMSEKKIGSVIVNDDDDKFLGIFTVTDALNALIEIARSGQRD